LYDSSLVVEATKIIENVLREGSHYNTTQKDEENGVWVSVHPLSNYHCYLLRIPFIDSETINTKFNSTAKYKRREFVWIPIARLLGKENIISRVSDIFEFGGESLDLHPRLITKDFETILRRITNLIK